MVAVAVLGLSLFGIMEGISYMRFRNRESSQRMLAASISTEILELFKAQPFPQITNSTPPDPNDLTKGPIYLKQLPLTGQPDPNWMVPEKGLVTDSNSWKPIPVEDVAPATATAPGLVADKLPNGEWRADFVSDPAKPSLQQVTVTLRWKLYQGMKQRFVSLSTSTTICQTFPSL